MSREDGSFFKAALRETDNWQMRDFVLTFVRLAACSPDNANFRAMSWKNLKLCKRVWNNSNLRADQTVQDRPSHLLLVTWIQIKQRLFTPLQMPC